MAKDLTLVDQIIFICNGGSCLKKGAEENTNILRASLKENEVDNSFHTIKTKCCGQCENGPIVFINPDNIWYKEIDAVASKQIVSQHLLKKEYLNNHFLYTENISHEKKGNFRKEA